MRSTISLLWKEYREQRWFLIAALVIFCGFPLIEATGRYLRPPAAQPGLPAPRAEFYSDSAVAMVLGLGGVLAIFVAIGSTTRDLRDELHVFWRSRPVGVARWMGIKYAAGLFTVLTACTIPALMQFWMAAGSGRHWSVAEVAGAVGIHSFAVVLIFSVAFLLGCLLRHATHAALLALAAAIAIYFLPVVVAPLAPLSVFNLMNNEALTLARNITRNPAGWNIDIFKPWRISIEPVEWTIFVAAMLGGSIAAVVLAMVTVARDWRVEADRRAMHWSLGGVAMLMFGATAFQVGSNLKVQRQFDLPLAKHTVVGFAFDGSRGAALLRSTENVQYYGQTDVKLCSVEATPDGAVRCGPIITIPEKMNVSWNWSSDVLFRRPQRPDRAHVLVEHSGWLPQTVNGRSYEVTLLQLLTLDLIGRSGDPVVHRLDLLPHLPDMQMSTMTFQQDARLFVAGRNEVVEIDLSDADAPRLARTIDTTEPRPGGAGRSNTLWTFSGESYDAVTGKPLVLVQLAPLPDMTLRQRLEATLALSLNNVRKALDGDLLVAGDGKTISTYRLAKLDEQYAVFDLVARREYTPLERLAGSYVSGITIIDGRAYAREHRMGNGLSAYDIRDPARPRSVGHFAVPKAPNLSVARLASGELLLAADRFYVLAPPKPLE